MQVTKFRPANDNGLVPAGRYFARLAAGLREANERAAAVVDVYEEQERKLNLAAAGKRHRPCKATDARRVEASLN